MKIQLQKHHRKGSAAPEWRASGHLELSIASSPPFYQRKIKGGIHRPRYGTTFIRNGVVTHAALEFWCGSGGFLEPEGKKQKGWLLDALPDDAVICHACEAKAIAAGLPKSVTQAGTPACLSVTIPRRRRVP